MDLDPQSEDSEWFEAVSETLAFEKEFVIIENLGPEERLIPHVKYSMDVRDELVEVEFCGWGDCLKESFEQAAQAMYAHLYDLNTIEIKGYCLVEAEGRDLADLFYRFVDELQFALGGAPHLVVRKIVIQEFDESTFLLRAKCYGEKYDPKRHQSSKSLETILKENVRIDRSPEGQYKVYYIIYS
ncbi:protein archease-like [Galendromus occidentalis]|uniref:Protein archease-like n=1 Tax=Galendromus occidentalis TaxID=34638 RepID=A0AAJ6QWM7_9ACAR|nr:protein archease-like [Galendromus occidentalis]